MMKIKQIIDALERFAPLPLQDGYDNSGLQVGLTEAEVTGVLLCLDVTEEIINEAIAKKCNLVISHHPLLFNKLISITGSNYVERCAMQAIKNDITIYSAHTNMDNTMYGVNYKIAEKLSFQHIEILNPREDSLIKLVTYVPVQYADVVRNAIFHIGGGCIGNYNDCSFNIKGIGTYTPEENTHPFRGEKGKAHKEEELRVEVIIPKHKEKSAVDALLKTHPYEEPAYDLIPLNNKWFQAGSGIIGELKEPISEMDFLNKIKSTFKVSRLCYNKFKCEKITRVALCGGAGAFLLPFAIKKRADVFITGEMHYHEYFGHDEDLLIAVIGHYESEQYTKEIFYSIIKDLYSELPIYMSSVNTNPIKYL